MTTKTLSQMSDKEVVRAAFPDVYKGKGTGWIWLAGGYLGENWHEARQHPTVQAWELSKAAEEAKVTLPLLNPSGNWPEDFSHENGNRQCRCVMCGAIFIGHPGRVECKACSMKRSETSAATESTAVGAGDSGVGGLETPYADDERKAAWPILWERFNGLPVPQERVWELQADITRLAGQRDAALESLKHVQAELEKRRTSAQVLACAYCYWKTDPLSENLDEERRWQQMRDHQKFCQKRREIAGF